MMKEKNQNIQKVFVYEFNILTSENEILYSNTRIGVGSDLIAVILKEEFKLKKEFIGLTIEIKYIRELNK